MKKAIPYLWQWRLAVAAVLCCGAGMPVELRAGELTDEELAVEAPAFATTVQASEVSEVVLEGIFEFGYQDEQGRYVVDVLEQDRAYLGVRITTPDGRPVQGATPSVAVEGTSRLLLTELETDELGVMNFSVIAGQMGLDSVTANIGEASAEFSINIISLRAAGFPEPQVVEGAMRWADLMSAKLEYGEKGIVVTFPDAIKEKAGETVKISGFMMPLQPELKQSHFLLTSNPPSCFFHIPGGPAGSVEVLAQEGIEVSWNPIVLEGRFEPQESNEMGVIYKLLDAKMIKP